MHNPKAVTDPRLKYDDGSPVIRNQQGLILCPRCAEPMVADEENGYDLYCPDCPQEQGGEPTNV